MEYDFPRKLGLKAGQRVSLVNPPQGFGEELAQIVPGIAFANGGGPEPVHMVVAWPERDVPAMFRQLLPIISPDGAIWVVIPKKAGKCPGPSFQCLLDAALPIGLVDNKTLSFSTTEYGIRFVIRRELRK